MNYTQPCDIPNELIEICKDPNFNPFARREYMNKSRFIHSLFNYEQIFYGSNNDFLQRKWLDFIATVNGVDIDCLLNKTKIPVVKIIRFLLVLATIYPKTPQVIFNHEQSLQTNDGRWIIRVE